MQHRHAPGRRAGSDLDRCVMLTIGRSARSAWASLLRDRRLARRRAAFRADSATTLSPGFTPSTCIRSPSFSRASPDVDFLHRALVARRRRRRSRSPRLTIASGRTAVTGLRSSAASASRQERDLGAHVRQHARVALDERIFTSTVALARSTVGTMRATSPRRRTSGNASSWISLGCRRAILPMRRFGDVGLDLERVHVGHR